MEDKEELKTRLKDLDFLKPAKNKQSGGTFYICPLCGSGTHAGQTAAFSIKDNKPTQWKCFSCNTGGDIFDLVALKHGKDSKRQFAEVKALVKEHLNISEPEQPYKEKKEYKPAISKTANQQQETIKYIDESKAFLLSGKHDYIVDYLTGRGLTPDTLYQFNIGYDPKRNRIVIPYNQSKTYYQTRTSSDNQSNYPKYMCQKDGTQEIFNLEALYRETGAACFVVEAPFCAMSLEQSGGNAIAIGGISGKDMLIETLKKKPSNKILAIALDMDQRGQQAQAELVKELKANNISFLEVWKEDYQGKKDFNDILQDDPDGLKGLCSLMNSPTEYKQENITRELNEYNKSIAAAVADIFPMTMETAEKPIPTGFSKLDEYLEGGLYAGLYVIGAVSSNGKTTFMLQMADNMAAAGNDVLYFSLEMTARELIAKSLARITYALSKESPEYKAKSMRELTSRKYIEYYTEQDRSTIIKAKERYQQYGGNIRIIDNMGIVSMAQIEETAHKHERLTGRKPVLIIDYLQIIAPEDNRAEVRQSLDNNIKRLKQLSKIMEIPVFVISSYSRAYYNSPVTMAANKESGLIEYGADVVMGLQLYGIGNDDFDVKKATNETPRQMEIVTLKSRFSPRDEGIRYEYYSKYDTFSEGISTFEGMGTEISLIDIAKRTGGKVRRF